MQKADFLERRDNFGFGKLAKATTAVSAPRIVQMSNTTTTIPSWQRNECAVRVAPTTSTEGSTLGMTASDPDKSHASRDWTSYLQSCLEACKRLAGCE